METVLYLDVYFLLNFVMDLVSLSLTALVTSERGTIGRLMLASLAGATCAAACAVFSLSDPWVLLLGMGSFLPMNRIAFGKKSGKRFLKLCLFSLFAFLFLGGAGEALRYYCFGVSREVGLSVGGFLAVIALAFGGFSLWERHLHRRLESAVIHVTLTVRGKKDHLVALVDSGAFLKEPTTGDPVMLFKAEYADSFFSGEELKQMERGEGPGFDMFPVPIRTATGRGCLFAFRPDELRVIPSGRERKRRVRATEAMVALDFSGGGFAGCPCLLPLSLL